MGARSKTSFLTSATGVEAQQMSKIQNRLVVKPKSIESLSSCKSNSMNLIYSSNHMWDAAASRVSYDLKGLIHFWPRSPNNY